MKPPDVCTVKQFGGKPAMKEVITELDLGCRPEAAVSGAVVVQTEYTTFLTFNAMRLMPDGLYHDVGTALVEFPGCCITKFGYPNDEAWEHIPRTQGLVYGIYEVQQSEWKTELDELNRFGFPNNTNESDGRHFLLLFHDSSFECIADEIRLDVINEPYEQVFARIARRVLAQ